MDVLYIIGWGRFLEHSLAKPAAELEHGHIIIIGIKNGCPCIVEIRGTQGCALFGDPARAVGECRDVVKAQP